MRIDISAPDQIFAEIDRSHESIDLMVRTQFVVKFSYESNQLIRFKPQKQK